ncbi:MAG: SpoIVB peptidase S55 domain-containing protein [Candidatus Bipolaricaulaceae bacterium]
MRLCTLLAVAMAGGLAWGAQDIIPLNEVRAGMTGHGLTVVAGTEVARFEVEVVGVLDEPGHMNDFIIVRAFGAAIDRSGGIAQGMSGSPVYLEGRLAGALSRAATWSAEPRRPLGLLTPIESMLAVFEEIKAWAPPTQQEEVPLPKEEKLMSLGLERLSLVTEPPDQPDPGTLYAWPLSAPVMASGLSQRALEALRTGVDLRLRDHPLLALRPTWRGRLAGLTELGAGRVLQAPAAPQSPAALPLEAGAPVGVGLLAGDVDVGALGTVTFSQGNAVVAFGHPFLFSGPVDYFLAAAHVFDTVAALDAPYKLGTMGEVRGAVVADRWAAVGGRTDLAARPVELGFSVWDEGRGQGTELGVRMVREPRLEPLLYFVAGLEAADRTLDRIGPGTVSLRYTIEGTGLPEPLERRNIFLSTEDVGAYVPWEAAVVLDVLEYNEFADPALTRVTMEASVSPELRAARVLDVALDNDSYAPGDTVGFTVYLQDWRGDQTTWSGNLRIPTDINTPFVELRAYGGPRPPERGEAGPLIESIGDLVAYIEDIPAYDTLTVELFALDPISELMGEAWVYGVDDVSVSVGGAVVYDEVSIIIPLDKG